MDSHVSQGFEEVFSIYPPAESFDIRIMLSWLPSGAQCRAVIPKFRRDESSTMLGPNAVIINRVDVKFLPGICVEHLFTAIS